MEEQFKIDQNDISERRADAAATDNAAAAGMDAASGGTAAGMSAIDCGTAAGGSAAAVAAEGQEAAGVAAGGVTEAAADAGQFRRQKVSVKKALLTALWMGAVGLIVGLIFSFYSWNSMSAVNQANVLVQMPLAVYYVVFSLQICLEYCLLPGFFGSLLAQAAGLNLRPAFYKKGLVVAVAGGIFFALLMLFDYGVFAQLIPQIGELYSGENHFTPMYLLVGISVGGFAEEVLLRWFVMSLFAVLLHLIFARKKQTYPIWIFVAANIIAALLFGAGHLPATAMTFGLTPLIVFRCFLLNSSLGLVLGYLYRKYGLVYSITCHALCHVFEFLLFAVIL